MMNKKARESLRKSKNNVIKRIYTFKTNQKALDELNVKVFETADIEWLDFIIMCRKCRETPHNYDVVIGPIADDNTSYCLNAYMEGMYGNPNTIQAKRTLMYNLEVENLGTQVFIGTKKGLSLINLIDEEKITC